MPNPTSMVSVGSGASPSSWDESGGSVFDCPWQEEEVGQPL